MPHQVLLRCSQVASHLIAGLSQAVDGCSAACAAPFGSASVGPPSRVAIAKAAYTVCPPSYPVPLHAGRRPAPPAPALAPCPSGRDNLRCIAGAQLSRDEQRRSMHSLLCQQTHCLGDGWVETGSMRPRRCLAQRPTGAEPGMAEPDVAWLRRRRPRRAWAACWRRSARRAASCARCSSTTRPS